MVIKNIYPYLDSELVDFMFSIDNKYKIQNGFKNTVERINKKNRRAQIKELKKLAGILLHTFGLQDKKITLQMI